MKWLVRRDTRHARLLVLRLRLRALRYGDDFAETYLALDALIYGVVMLLPGDTTGGSKAFTDIAALLHGDVGIGLLFSALAVALTLSTLRLVSEDVQRGILVVTFAVWMGMSVGFFAGYAWSLGPWIGLLNALAAWVAYLRSDV